MQNMGENLPPFGIGFLSTGFFISFYAISTFSAFSFPFTSAVPPPSSLTLGPCCLLFFLSLLFISFCLVRHYSECSTGQTFCLLSSNVGGLFLRSVCFPSSRQHLNLFSQYSTLEGGGPSYTQEGLISFPLRTSLTIANFSLVRSILLRVLRNFLIYLPSFIMTSEV